VQSGGKTRCGAWAHSIQVRGRETFRTKLAGSTRAIQADRIDVGDGQFVEADLVIMGVGVSPRTALAEAAGIRVDNGVIVG